MSDVLDAIKRVKQPKSSVMQSIDRVKSNRNADSTKTFSKPVWDPNAPLDLLEGTSTYDKFMAGVGRGATGMLEGAINMVGAGDLVKDLTGFDATDEGIQESKELWSPLSKTTSGSVGQFVGEVAALAPLGFVGKGAQVGSGLLKSKGMLPTVSKVLSSRAAPVVTEGALAGAIAANPNEREFGAALGATTAGALNLTRAVLGRTFNRGLVKENPTAKKLTEMIKEQTGRDTFIPLRQARAPEGGTLSDTATAVMNLGGMLPAARDKLTQQSGNLAMDAYEMNLRQALNPVKGKIAAKVLRKTKGDVQMALDMGKRGPNTRQDSKVLQNILSDTTRPSMMGQYTPTQLYNTAQKTAVRRGQEASQGSFRETAKIMAEILEKPSSKSDVATRDVYHTLGNQMGVLPGVAPGLSSFIGSEGLQKFMMGNLGAQKLLQKALKTGAVQPVLEVFRAIQRTMAVQPVVQDELYVNQAADALRGRE